MNVSLTKPLENYIQSKVESSMYASASEVIRAALRILRERDIEASIEEGIGRGLIDSSAGRTMSSDECFDRVRDNLRKKHQ